MSRNKISLHFNFREDYKYPFFLLTLVAYLFLPAIIGPADNNLLSNVLFILFIISSLALVRAASKITMFLTYLIGVTGILFEVYERFIGTPLIVFQVLFRLLFLIYFILLLVELIKQIFSAENITLNVILGAFTGYIMLGIIGFFIFRAIYFADPSSFVEFSDPPNDLIYYTFITITTIGYGDIAPLSVVGRNFAVILGLAGQFYNTVIIAIIIGKFLQK